MTHRQIGMEWVIASGNLANKIPSFSLLERSVHITYYNTNKANKKDEN